MLTGRRQHSARRLALSCIAAGSRCTPATPAGPLYNDSCAPAAHLTHVPQCFRLPLLPLQRRGFKVYVLPLERKDWFKVGRALFTRAYWSTSCTTHPGYTW